MALKKFLAPVVICSTEITGHKNDQKNGKTFFVSKLTKNSTAVLGRIIFELDYDASSKIYIEDNNCNNENCRFGIP